MLERQARDLEVRVRIPVQVQIFLLKLMNNRPIYIIFLNFGKKISEISYLFHHSDLKDG